MRGCVRFLTGHVLSLIIASGSMAALHAQSQRASTDKEQPPPTSSPQHPPGQAQMMEMTGPLGIAQTREASGTSWLPDQSPMYAVHRELAGWQVMLHGNGFLQYINQRGRRGDEQVGSINWLMGMGRRGLVGGELTVRAMLSVEPWTVGDCGYPDLLASGEFCDDQPLHDRQHPHDLFMEVAAAYQREAGSNLAYQLYAGLAGEPALGPTAYPHRVSSIPNPFAPITHHWLDATHISFGVLTGGIFSRRWKLEGSLFNGREPDQERFDFDLAPLDSVSARAWFLPTDRWALQVSTGRLEEAELHEIGGVREDVIRTTASATYHRPLGQPGARTWATTAAWGRNGEEDRATHAFLVETVANLTEADTVFGRFEMAGKTGEDLVLPEALHEDTFTVAKLQTGYARQFGDFASLVPSAGFSVSVSATPERLRTFYGDRPAFGFALFLNLRPAAMAAMMPHEMGTRGR